MGVGVHAWLGEASLVELMSCRCLAQTAAAKPCEFEPCALSRLCYGVHTLYMHYGGIITCIIVKTSCAYKFDFSLIA